MRVLKPVAEEWLTRRRPLAPLLGLLQGKTICFLDNDYHNADIFLARIEASMKEADKTCLTFRKKKEFKWAPGSPELLDEIARKADAVVVGVGHSGSCTSWSVYDSASLESEGIPTVTVVETSFASLARQARDSLGLPDLPLVEVSGPLCGVPGALVHRTADAALEQVLDALMGAAREHIVLPAREA